MKQYWFKSSLFDIEPGEDEEINPRMYGRQLANWLKTQLELRGYDVEPVIAEDWGRCLMCTRDPFMLWIGCGSVLEYSTSKPDEPPPSKEAVIWTCFTTAEVSLWKKIFSRPDTAPALEKLNADLAFILASEPSISLVEEP